MTKALMEWCRHSLVVTLLVGLLAGCSGAAQPIEPSYSGAPSVTLVSPMMNDAYRAGAPVNILLRVENAGPDIERVTVTINGAVAGEAMQPNPSGAPAFAVTNLWTAPGPGSYAINAVAARADGTSSEIASVSVDVVADTQTISEPIVSESQAEPTAQPAATQAPEQVESADTAAATAIPTTPPPSATPTIPNTPSQPQVRVNVGANVRSGPSQDFSIVGSYAAGTVTDLLAVAPGATWYKIQYYNGEAWIAAALIETIGDTASLPIDVGPPTPIPVTNTPVPTSTPAAVADLSIVFWSPPGTIRCGNAATTSVTVANSGTGPSSATTVILEDLVNGNVQTTASADIQALGPGENATVDLTLTATTFVFEGHTLRARVDPNGSVAETNEGNNERTQNFTLESGAC